MNTEAGFCLKTLLRIFALALFAFVFAQTSRLFASGTGGFNSDPVLGRGSRIHYGEPRVPGCFFHQYRIDMEYRQKRGVRPRGRRHPRSLDAGDGNVMWCARTSGTTFGRCDYFSLIKSTDYGQTWNLCSTFTPSQGPPGASGPRLYRDRDGSLHVIVAVSPRRCGARRRRSLF